MTENEYNLLGIIIMCFSFLSLLIIGEDGMIISIMIILAAIMVMLSGSENI